MVQLEPNVTEKHSKQIFNFSSNFLSSDCIDIFMKKN